jgi:hypothetical protein
VPLECVEAPYRDLTEAVEDHLDELDRRWPGTTITVVISQYAGGRIVDDLLRNQTLVVLREQLLFRTGVAVASLPYRISPAAPSPGGPPT